MAARELVGWQACALLLAATGLFSQLLADRGVRLPTAQTLANYALLSVHLVCWWRGARARGERAPTSSARPWQWLLLAVADVEANYLLVLSYQYTDITSVTLLDAFTVPCVMALSAGLFGARYSRRQLIAVGLCLGGLAVLVATDVSLGAPSHAPHRVPWLGDLLVLAGAALYAVSNVVEERFLRAHSREDFLGHLGGYGAAVSAAQCAALERPAIAAAIAAVREPGGGLALLALELGFVGSLFGVYVLVSALLHAGSSAVVMNLSLLTSDFWSVLAGVLLLGSASRLTPWYALSFASVVCGLCLYHLDHARPAAGGGGGGGGAASCAGATLPSTALVGARVDTSRDGLAERLLTDSDARAKTAS